MDKVDIYFQRTEINLKKNIVSFVSDEEGLYKDALRLKQATTQYCR